MKDFIPQVKSPIDLVPTLNLWLDWAEANGISQRMQSIVIKHWEVINHPDTPFTLAELVRIDRMLANMVTLGGKRGQAQDDL